VRRGGHRRRRDTEQPPGRWVVAVALAVSPSPSRHWLPRRKRRPHRRVRCTGSRLRGCGCRGCPNACCAVRRLSASRCPVSGVRCPRVRCPVSARPVAGVPGCPLWGVRVRASRVRVRPVRAGGVLWSASVRGGPTVWDGRLCRGRPPVSASGRSSAQVRRDWSGGGCAGPSGDVGRGPGRCLGVRSGGGCGHVRPPADQDSRLAQRVARRLVEGSRWGSGARDVRPRAGWLRRSSGAGLRA
jgi:hypothetical protein